MDSFDFIGSFTEQDALHRNLHLAKGVGGNLNSGYLVHLHLLVDLEDGVIVDACFQSYSHFDIALAMEALCSFCQRKTYVQASQISAKILQKELRNPLKEINICLEALDEATETCSHIKPSKALNTPQPLHSEEEQQLIEGFATLSKSQKKQIIERVLDEKVRPYIEMDAGGLEVVDLNKNELFIRYTGACTSCPSSIGGTLAYIENTLSSTVDPNLVVRPLLDEADATSTFFQ